MAAVRLPYAALLLWAAAGCGAAVQAVYAGDDPREWLARTDQALTTRNYEGVFVHEHAGQTETLRVIHRVSGDAVSERLLSMDGSGREFVRKGAELICYLPDQRVVLVEQGSDAGLLLAGLPRIDTNSAAQYDVREIARARVSGRDARVITVTPMDKLRYGYRLWIDEATAMPLKSQLRDSNNQVIDQIVFTSLSLPAHIADAMLEPAVDARGYRWIRRDRNSVADRNAPVSWQANMLPPGFRMTVSATQVLPGAVGPVEHLVFSDGLASVSVFVEMQPDTGSASASEAVTSLGSSAVYSTVIEGYRVTAIGEVPPDTVRAIARSMHAADRGAGGDMSASSGSQVGSSVAISSVAVGSESELLGGGSDTQSSLGLRNRDAAGRFGQSAGWSNAGPASNSFNGNGLGAPTAAPPGLGGVPGFGGPGPGVARGGGPR